VNETGAKLIGININKFRLLCFALAGGLGAMTGIVTTPVTFTGYEVGALTGLKGLVVAIVGGWSIGGTVIAALILGLLEGFCAGFVSTGFKDVLALVAMIIFLIIKTYRRAPKTRRT
jgi:branched-chain amino acid transport system permease protein